MKEGNDGSGLKPSAEPSAQKHYAISTDEERYYGEFDSVEMALACAEDEVGAEPGETVWVGEVNKPDGSEFMPDANHLLESMQERADEAAGEFSETWLERVPKDAREALQERLEEMLSKWMDDFAQRPNFYLVTNAKEYTVPAEVPEASPASPAESSEPEQTPPGNPGVTWEERKIDG